MCLKVTSRTFVAMEPITVYVIRILVEGKIRSPYRIDVTWVKKIEKFLPPKRFKLLRLIRARVFHAFINEKDALNLARLDSSGKYGVFECLIPAGSYVTTGLNTSMDDVCEGTRGVVSNRLILMRKASQFRYGKHYLRRDVVYPKRLKRFKLWKEEDINTSGIITINYEWSGA